MKTKPASFRVPAELYEVAKKIAKANNIGIADLLRDCVRYELGAMRLFGYGKFVGEMHLPDPPALKNKKPDFVKEPIPETLRWAVFERDGFKCKKCPSRRFLRADHIIPESRGGRATLENLQTLCASCNSKKGTKNA